MYALYTASPRYRAIHVYVCDTKRPLIKLSKHPNITHWRLRDQTGWCNGTSNAWEYFTETMPGLVVKIIWYKGEEDEIYKQFS